MQESKNGQQQQSAVNGNDGLLIYHNSRHYPADDKCCPKASICSSRVFLGTLEHRVGLGQEESVAFLHWAKILGRRLAPLTCAWRACKGVSAASLSRATLEIGG